MVYTDVWKKVFFTVSGETGGPYMKIGISENFRLIKVFEGISYACIKDSVLKAYKKTGDDDDNPLVTARYPDFDRASEALEKLMKKDYLTIPQDYVETIIR